MDAQTVDTALAAFGLVADRPALPADEPYYLWPELAPGFELWTQLQTQWRRTGLEGRPTGLDYSGVAAVMRILGLRPKVQRERLWQIQAMERAALDFWAEK